jgi:hypothetical protein
MLTYLLLEGQSYGATGIGEHTGCIHKTAGDCSRMCRATLAVYPLVVAYREGVEMSGRLEMRVVTKIWAGYVPGCGG